MIFPTEIQIKVNSTFKHAKSVKLTRLNIIIDKGNYKESLIDAFLILKGIYKNKYFVIFNTEQFRRYFNKNIKLSIKFLANDKVSPP